MAIFLRSGFPFNYDTVKESDASGLKCVDKSLTRQSEAEQADINTIVKRFHLSGELPQGVRVPSYGDFSGVFDYQSALNLVRQADESFAAMPAVVRSRFHNDPQEFVAFCERDENRAEAEKLGLVLKKVPTGSDVLPVASPAVVAPLLVPGTAKPS